LLVVIVVVVVPVIVIVVAVVIVVWHHTEIQRGKFVESEKTTFRNVVVEINKFLANCTSQHWRLPAGRKGRRKCWILRLLLLHLTAWQKQNISFPQQKENKNHQ
jgi:hypothetical protein